jgi:hypothetical protein
MKLPIIIEQIRLMDLEQKHAERIRQKMTGDPNTDKEAFEIIAGNAAINGWREGLEMVLAIRGKPYKFRPMPPRIEGNIDSRAAHCFREAADIFSIRLKHKKGMADQDKYYTEYIKALTTGIRAIIQDAANAGQIYGAGL